MNHKLNLLQQTIDKQNQQLEEIKNKIQIAVPTEERMNDFGEKLEEIRGLIKDLIG